MNAPADILLPPQPPHSIEAEQSLIGGLLLDGRAWDRVADVVSEADFYRDDQDLLAFVLRLAVEFSQRVGLYAVVVNAKHDKAKAFYARMGFIACVDNPLCLYLPIATLEQSIAP